MTINRATQNWPSDVTTEIPETDLSQFSPALEEESQMEFERRQRGSASTVAALFLVALFAVFALAIYPLLNSLSGQ
jgi:hypothetical protein